MMMLEYKNAQVDLAPTKIVAVARNYRAHAEEMGSPVPEIPTIFLKPPSSLIGDDGVIVLPAASQRVDHEVELAVVMKDRCKNVSAREALDFVMGYTVFIDVTARDLQAEARKKGLSWAVSKGFDTFAPIGPKIVAKDEIDPHSLDIWLKINGVYRQNGTTQDMLFPVDELISHITGIMTLEPMDIIATGTPEGVGPMVEGDVVEAGIEGIGVLTAAVQRDR
ncbi:MAG: fumarylacetoacetate hydrolase family protein [Theionarchaea archaeon]|nr:fumarylacetoacetate hydrolase family protein [Theionarchaea archaeon]MBU6999560.1 fumarylacetoacetate hydrolase family protein [Theionarchaea archaeon]MBU7020276.1 fumarylacetoacetate hydrolase family protein [Theionarchaea archaeon]MBU7041494.1 fumarylacetoacetate hydrolase family protein [Theionarchaea archaeon]